jgi:hypothetical protein
MDWVADVGSMIAAGAAFWAAVAATALVRKSQRQVETAQRQNDLAQLEYFASNRPLVIPSGSLGRGLNADGTSFVDLNRPQPVEISNIGSGVALNLSLVLFGSPSKPASGMLPNRVIAWLEPPLPAGSLRVVQLTPGASSFNGDVCIGNDSTMSLFGPPTPSYDEIALGAVIQILARLTMTYHDIFGRKHSSTYDCDVLGRWISRGYKEDIPQDLGDFEASVGTERLAMQRSQR